jgi:DNA-binding XRE family transcriptional regulator
MLSLMLGNLPSELDIWSAPPHDSAMSTAAPQLRHRVRVARAERDLSQEQLARMVDVSRQTISSIENGQYCPSTLLAFRLASALGVPVDRRFWVEGGSE